MSCVNFLFVRSLWQDPDEAVGGVRWSTGHSGGSPRHRRVRPTLSPRQKVRPLFNFLKKWNPLFSSGFNTLNSCLVQTIWAITLSSKSIFTCQIARTIVSLSLYTVLLRHALFRVFFPFFSAWSVLSKGKCSRRAVQFTQTWKCCLCSLDLFIYLLPTYFRVIEQLGGKQLVMNHMHHEDQLVRYNALLCVQKLMVHNWYDRFYLFAHSHSPSDKNQLLMSNLFIAVLAASPPTVALIYLCLEVWTLSLQLNCSRLCLCTLCASSVVSLGYLALRRNIIVCKRPLPFIWSEQHALFTTAHHTQSPWECCRGVSLRGSRHCAAAVMTTVPRNVSHISFESSTEADVSLAEIV